MITKKYYKLVKVSYEDSGYFYVKNVSDQNGTLTIGAGGNLGLNIDYTTDGANWTTANSNAPFSLVIPVGGKVYLRGTNSGFGFKTISMNANHIVGGNVYSLLDKTNYATRTNSVTSSELADLFSGNTNLISAADMTFGNVTTLAHSAYRSMFENCTSLTAAPEMPKATTIPNFCCWGMFENCTSLTAAPELPATTIGEKSYHEMFRKCSSLQSIKCLATDISASQSTYLWVIDVPQTGGTFIKNANMSGWTTGPSGIPSGWTVVDA